MSQKLKHILMIECVIEWQTGLYRSSYKTINIAVAVSCKKFLVGQKIKISQLTILMSKKSLPNFLK